MLRYFSNGIPRSSVSSPLAARITRVRGARPAVFYKDGKTAHHTGSVSHAVRRRPRITCTHSPANDARRRRSADEATKKEGLFFYPPPPASPPPFASSRVRPSLPDRARAQGIKGCATRPGNRCVPLDAPRARTRRMPTSSHEFRDTRTHPSIPRIVRPSPPSRRIASRPVASIIVAPRHRRHPAAPRSPPRVVTRPPTTPPPTSGQTRVKNTSSPHSARAPRTVPLARPVAVVDTVVVVIVPIIIVLVLVLVARAESSRRRVTSRRPARDRWVYWFFLVVFFWILIGFGVCPLRTCRVVYS